MVAVIKTGHSLKRILNYNEHKVSQGVAQCIGEGNYPMDVQAMNLTVKLNRLVQQAELNTNVTRHSVHISLNFDPSEKDLPPQKLMAIATEYMAKIGFGNQPYLVYQHHDAAHPHIHIVSVKVRSDGSRIDMQNIGKNQSEVARQEIEKKYGLIAANENKKTLQDKLHPINISKVSYGKSPTKRAITNILDAVIPAYKYTSLHELNAILGLYNVSADRGTENSRIYQNNGLLYRVVDSDGNKIGIPIKASSIYNSPTLLRLETYFKTNELARQPYKSRLKNTIDRFFHNNKTAPITAFRSALEKEGITTVLRQNDKGVVYGITYVDHQTKSVFNGSALGKQYSAKAIEQRCNEERINPDKHTAISKKIIDPQTLGMIDRHENFDISSKGPESVIDLLLRNENTLDYIPGKLRGKKRKKKRKGPSDNL